MFDSIVLQWAAAQQPMPSPFLPGMQQTNPGYLQVIKSFSSNPKPSPSSESGAVPQPEGLGDEDIAGAANDCQDLTPGFAPVM